jgi:hypothetical protein
MKNLTKLLLIVLTPANQKKYSLNYVIGQVRLHIGHIPYRRLALSPKFRVYTATIATARIYLQNATEKIMG